MRHPSRSVRSLLMCHQLGPEAFETTWPMSVHFILSLHWSPPLIVVSRTFWVWTLLLASTTLLTRGRQPLSTAVTLNRDSCNVLLITFLCFHFLQKRPVPIMLFASPDPPPTGNVLLPTLLRGRGHTLITNLRIWCLGHESEDSMSTLAGRRGMRPKMMMPFDSQPPQRKLKASRFPVLPVYPVVLGNRYERSLWLHMILTQEMTHRSSGTLSRKYQHFHILQLTWFSRLFFFR